MNCEWRFTARIPSRRIRLAGKTGQATLDAEHHMVSVTVPDDGHGSDLEIKAKP